MAEEITVVMISVDMIMAVMTTVDMIMVVVLTMAAGMITKMFWITPVMF